VSQRCYDIELASVQNSEKLADHTILIANVDDTEFEVKTDAYVGSYKPLMIMHGTHVARRNNRLEVRSLVMPPAVLADQTARTIETALDSRLSPFGEALKHPDRHCDILGSDSARANVRVTVERAARIRIPEVSGKRFSLHARCMMHMFFASISGMMKPLDMMASMFCGTVLMHRSDNITAVRKACRKWLEDHLVVSFEEPDDSAYRAYSEAVVNMLVWADEDTALRERVPTADAGKWQARRGGRGVNSHTRRARNHVPGLMKQFWVSLRACLVHRRGADIAAMIH
jgi:hypothetical protein